MAAIEAPSVLVSQYLAYYDLTFTNKVLKTPTLCPTLNEQSLAIPIFG